MTHQTLFFEIVLRKKFGSAAAAREVLLGMALKLFALHNGRAVQVDTATVSEADATSKTEVVSSMHNHDLPCDQGTGLVVIHTMFIADSIKDITYPYVFHQNEEVQTFFGDMISNRFYVWDI